jgi:hypothetical protein
MKFSLIGKPLYFRLLLRASQGPTEIKCFADAGLVSSHWIDVLLGEQNHR